MESASDVSEVLGGAIVVVALLAIAGLTRWAQRIVQKAFHKVIDGFKDEIVTSLTEISTSVEQVNKAVNHVKPGTPPLTQRVDRIEETQTKAKSQLEDFIEDTNGKFKSINEKQDVTNASIEKLLESHVETRKRFDDAIKAIPKRKDDYEEAS